MQRQVAALVPQHCVATTRLPRHKTALIRDLHQCLRQFGKIPPQQNRTTRRSGESASLLTGIHRRLWQIGFAYERLLVMLSSHTFHAGRLLAVFAGKQRGRTFALVVGP